MTWTRPARRTQPRAAMLLRLLTLTLMVLVFAVFAAHHSDERPIGATEASGTGTASSIAADAVALTGDAVAAFSAAVAGNDWAATALTACAALGLCAVLGMALLRRPLGAGHAALSGTAPPATAPRTTPAEAVASPRPSLLVLSISRT